MKQGLRWETFQNVSWFTGEKSHMLINIFLSFHAIPKSYNDENGDILNEVEHKRVNDITPTKLIFR